MTLLTTTVRTIGAALKRYLLGRSTHAYMRHYARSESAAVAQTAGMRVPAEVLEYEPVFGWTERQLVDYMARNPGYRVHYETVLRSRQKHK